jgi:Gpi18-like mannosyltransferase
MDLTQEITRSYFEMVSGMDSGVKIYLFRIASGLTAMAILSVHFVRRTGFDQSTLARQVVTITIGCLVVLLLPAQLLLEAPRVLQLIAISFAIFADLAFPYFLPCYLIRTYGRQKQARWILYGIIFFGLLLQLAVSGRQIG